MTIPVGHNPVLIADKEVSDGQHAILVRCDDDPNTDAWHTISISAKTTAEDVQAEIDGHMDRVANLHAAALNARTVIAAAVAAAKVTKAL